MSEGAGTGGPPPHRFGTGEHFSIGLEEELLLVDPDTLELAHGADAVLARSALPRDRLDHEAFLAELEGRSEPSGSVGEAIGQLAESRAAAAGAGATLLAAGLHPHAKLFDVELVQSERYERVEAQMQGLIKRTPECALHVHVGVPSPEGAVAAMNGLRQLLPLLHGLGANSPFWFGADSGMASSRAAVIRAYPGRGIPPLLRSWEQYLACLDAVRAGGGPTDHTMVWWDARPQPRLGTVELREVDVQTDLDSAAAIAALARAIMRRAVEEPSAAGVAGVAGEPAPAAHEALDALARTLAERRRDRSERSYTVALIDDPDRIGAKVREEADEVARAAAGESDERVAEEAADLLYHLEVLLLARDVPLAAALEELNGRRR